MLIQPDTNIKILSGCPLDNRYEHTLYFESAAEQKAYFASLAKHNLTKHSYQRYDKGVLTVQLPADDLYDCNYMMFQNASYSNKWFYAFINSVEYVNNVTARVHYQIDVMQTWFFEHTLKSCFVEREHPKTDEPGDNVVRENVHFGEYVFGESVTPWSNNGEGISMGDLSMVIMYNPTRLDLAEKHPDLDHFHYPSGVYSGVYQGVEFFVIPVTQNNAQILDRLVKTADQYTSGGIVCCFLMPTVFVPGKNGYYQHNERESMILYRNADFEGYVPRNKKLFTYPYTCAYLTSNRGTGNDFAFERFIVKDRAAFATEANFSVNPTAICFPLNYAGVDEFLEGSVSIASYPICTWSSDGVTEWVNNNLFRGMADTANNGALTLAATMGASVSTGVATGVLASAVNSAIGFAKSFVDPGTVHGSGDGDIMIGNSNGRLIHAKVKHITAANAKIVDDYFAKFGYAVNEVKIPERNSRPCWNYVKTIGCAVSGCAPADDLRAICELYDKGITFWNKGEEVGDYTLDNSPKGVE